jgi:hypothetical protein
MLLSRRLPLDFDAEALRVDVMAFGADEWIDHFVPQNYRGSWQVIPLRGLAGETHPVRMIYSDPTRMDFEDTPLLERAPALGEALRRFPCPVGSARLMKLGPGSRILEHRDLDLAPESGHARLHVPIQTNDDVVFLLAGERVRMQAGECWYLRLSEPHEVRNDGDEDRVHLVLDAEIDDWLSALIRP